MGGVSDSTPWFVRVDVRGLSEESRRLILERVDRKLGFNREKETPREIC
jgi:hypothetical protein